MLDIKPFKWIIFSLTFEENQMLFNHQTKDSFITVTHKMVMRLLSSKKFRKIRNLSMVIEQVYMDYYFTGLEISSNTILISVIWMDYMQKCNIKWDLYLYE